MPLISTSTTSPGTMLPSAPLGAHPEHVARVEGRVLTQLLNPGRRIPYLVSR
jgi:hypothetical protein